MISDYRAKAETSSLFETRETREAREVEERLKRERERDQRIAEAEAFHAAADMQMPADLREMAARHGLCEFMAAVWRSGWQSGFRHGLKRTGPAPQSSTKDESHVG